MGEKTDKSMNVTHRLIAFAKSKKLSVSGFEAAINQPGRLQAAKQNNRTPNVDLLEVISEVYPDLNMNWVITGKGEMMLQQTATENENQLNEPNSTYNKESDIENKAIDLLESLLPLMKEKLKQKKSEPVMEAA